MEKVFLLHDVAWRGESRKEQVILHVDKLPLYFFVLFVDIFTRSFDDFISTKFLIAVFCHPPRILFWPKFASLPAYFALPFNLKLESKWETPVKFVLIFDLLCFLIRIRQAGKFNLSKQWSGWLLQKLFLKNLQNSQENCGIRVSF